MDISPVGTKIQHLSHFMSKFSGEKRKNAYRLYGKTLKKKRKKKVKSPYLIVVLRQANHSRLHRSDGFVFSVMWNIWRTMEKIVDPMACVGTNNRTSIRSCNRLAV